ncbi:MAG: diguanylate cyclase [Stigonema ocellatum SAG 48.90 = DSM 106950]|nr:diguanylate cyclase [Stigonema ocellatum SAG 48.90 = DSM 106950]
MIKNSNDLPLKVLCIDDNEDDYVMIREMLWDMEIPPFELEWVSTYETGLAAIARQEHDVCLLDYRLGCHSGLEVLKKARRCGYQAPIILLTRFLNRSIDLEAMDLGATNFLNKNEISASVLERSLRYAIRQKQAEEALRQQAEKERRLQEVTQHIRSSLDMEKILTTTVVKIRQLLQADRVLIYRIDPDDTGKVIAESVVSSYPTLLHQTFSVEKYPQKCCLFHQKGEVYTMTDIQQDDLSTIVVPLLFDHQMRSELQEELWGLLIVHQYGVSRKWQAIELDLLKQLATQVEIALQQSQLYQHLQTINQRLQNLATLDGLTQIANRRNFDDFLMQEWKRLAREQSPLALILCDIDYFKKYNDSYGHLAGDACLVEIAQAINSCVRRPADLAARYGGEEFAVILANTDSNGAVQVVKNIREQIRLLNYPHADSVISRQVTLSFGIAHHIPTPNSSPSIILQKADEALYQAKANGRNCYYVSQQQKIAGSQYSSVKNNYRFV